MWPALLFATVIGSTAVAQIAMPAIGDSARSSSGLGGSGRPLNGRDTTGPGRGTAIRQAVDQNIKVVKRQLDYHEQVVLAVGMMLFVAFMMTTAQTWNPR